MKKGGERMEKNGYSSRAVTAAVSTAVLIARVMRDETGIRDRELASEGERRNRYRLESR